MINYVLPLLHNKQKPLADGVYPIYLIVYIPQSVNDRYNCPEYLLFQQLFPNETYVLIATCCPPLSLYPIG